MAGTFQFELVTPARMLIPAPSDDGKTVTPAEAEQVIVPGLDGEFTVLKGHAPLVTTLRPGVLDITLASGRRRVYLRGGIAEVAPDRLTILAQHLLDLDNLADGDLAAERQAAEAMLNEAKDDTDRMMARSALAALQSVGA